MGPGYRSIYKRSGGGYWGEALKSAHYKKYSKTDRSVQTGDNRYELKEIQEPLGTPFVFHLNVYNQKHTEKYKDRSNRSDSYNTHLILCCTE